MLKSLLRKTIGLSFIPLIFITSSFSQNTDLSDIGSDFNFLINKYVTPVNEGLVYQTSSAWNTDAKALKLWEVKLSLQASFLLIPNNKRSFFVTNSSFNNLSIVGADSATIPTAVGGENNIALQGMLNDDSFEFEPPEGIDQNNVFHPQIQAALGLPYNTNVILRFAPDMDIGDSNIEAYGVGLLHSISQWFPKLKTSTYDIAATFSYTKYKIDLEFSDLEIIQDGGVVNAIISDGSTINGGIIGSKKIGAFDISTAVNYSYSSPDIAFEGEGALLSILNPIIKSNDLSTSSLTMDFGVNYNYKDFSINTIFTIGDFRNLLVGLNYTIRHRSNTNEQNKN